jgi:hypothetical protein
MRKPSTIKRERIRGGEKRKPIYSGVGGILARAVDATLGFRATHRAT